MSISPKTLIPTKYAETSDTAEYTAPAGTHTIVDKFTATNTDSGAVTISINIVTSGSSVGSSNLITKTASVAAGVTYSATEMQNQILSPGDSISVVSNTSSKMVIRASGREVT